MLCLEMLAISSKKHKKSPKWTGKMMIDYDRLMGFGDFMEYSIFRPADEAWDTQISRRSTRQKCWSPDKINTGWGPLQIAFSWDSGWILWYMNYPAKSDNFYGNSPKNAEHYRCPNNKLYGDLPNAEAKLAPGKPLSPQIVAPVQGSGTGVFGSRDFRQQ